jgi:hypothetical protein
MRIIRKGLSFGSKSFPKKHALCSEPPDEHALVLTFIILSNQKKNLVNGTMISMRTNWATVLIYYTWTGLAPFKMCPCDRGCEPQPNLCIFGVDKSSDPPRLDQGTPSNKDEFFHALYAQSIASCERKPAIHMVSDVVLEHLRADNIFADAILGKREKRTLLPPAPIRGKERTP